MAADQILDRLLTSSATWPERVAFVSAQGSLSFGALRRAALGHAAWLAGQAGVRPGDRVALSLPRSLEGVQAIFGILAAGAVYVPIQFQGPVRRLQSILASIEPKFLLTTADTARRLAALDDRPTPVASLAIESDGLGLVPFLASPGPSPIPERRAEDLGAIYFTSGSTGRPKGVMMSYGSLGAMASWIVRWAGLTAEDRLMSDAGLHYATAFDLLKPLFSGCRTFLLSDREAMFPARVVETMSSERASLWCSSATTLRLLYQSEEFERRDLTALRRVEFFGEPLSLAVLRRLMAILPGAAFVNFYGATEAHRIAAYIVPRPLPDDLVALPVGRPTDNYAMSLREEAGGEAVPGKIGEICVAGAKCLSGYWGDPLQSAASRLDGQPNSYRTGDLARIEPNGMIHLVGRADRMVKLRGHRFDLGEIETVLKTDPGVEEALAFAFSNPRDEVEIRVAVSGRAADGLEARLGRLAAEQLPAYARPARIAVLSGLPQLSNGKIDRQELQRLLTDS